MDGAGLGWITSLGSSAAAIAVVVLFLRHLASERLSRVQQTASRDEVITKCVDRNSEVITRNTEVLGQTVESLRRVNVD